MVFALIMYLLGLEIRYRPGMEVKKNSFQAFLFAARPNTLTASVAPVLVGATIAAMDMYPDPNVHFSWIPYILCLEFAVGMQIASNLINDLYDFKKGTDDAKRLGPPRACAMGWADVDVMKKWIIRVIVLALLLATPVIYYAGIGLMAIGALCVIFAFLYTTFFSYRGLGDILVLLFFGIIPVCFTYYIQAKTITWQVAAVSLGMGFVVDMLLTVNNLRDIEGDRASGKMTLAVRLGAEFTRTGYLLLGLLGIVFAMSFFLVGKYIPVIATAPYLVFHICTYLKMKRIPGGRDLNLILEKTATNIFLFGFFLSAGCLIQMAIA